jgi:hypothetical protein
VGAVRRYLANKGDGSDEWRIIIKMAQLEWMRAEYPCLRDSDIVRERLRELADKLK